MPEQSSRVTAQQNVIETKNIEGWTRSVEAFSRMIDRLQADYAELEAKHAELNAELASMNDSLHLAAEANSRLAAYRDRIVAAVTAGIITVDGNGIVRLFNPAAARLLDKSPDAVLNRPYAEVWPDRRDDPATALACAQGADPVNEQRREYPRPGAMPLIVSVSTIRLGTSPSEGALEVFTDMTQSERMHHELTRMRTLAALGEMSATVAHEIRNPLGGIIGFAELLARNSDGDPKRKDMVNKIVTGAHHLNLLVGRLLEFAREPKLTLRPLEWRPFLDTTLDQYEDNARRRGARLTLKRRFPERLPTGRADGLCLRQAIWNVLENAEHAVRDDGHVEVDSQLLTDGSLSVCITDNGPGIDAEMRERVFSPFVTTKKKGTGLGLATARKFVEAHGGTVTIDSQSGAGTTVSIVLPPISEEG
ncbi:MAG: PAS domain-containing protein [candidate division Zixibacteria bacterium]|nr:PAS domain-containing protein [candidate division Zixibacteria bacterium]